MGEESNISHLRQQANMNIQKPLDVPSPSGLTEPTSLEDQVQKTAYRAARKMRENEQLTGENVQISKELIEAQFHDNLTGLLNLQGIEKIIDEKIITAEKRSFGVLFIDFNQFKPVNDRLGHAVGDELLKTFANKIHGIFGDHTARAGGDEFITMVDLSSTDKNRQLTPQRRLASHEENIHKIMIEIGQEDPRFADVSAAVGGAVWIGGSVEEILREADNRMLADKPEDSR